MNKPFSEEEIVDYICGKLKAFLLNKEIFGTLDLSIKSNRKNSSLTSELGAFPLYMKVSDAMDATQYSRSVIYRLIKQMEHQVPGSVIRRGEKGIRLHRDKFFEWFMTHGRKNKVRE